MITKSNLSRQTDSDSDDSGDGYVQLDALLPTSPPTTTTSSDNYNLRGGCL